MGRRAPTSPFSSNPIPFNIEPVTTMTQAQLTLPLAPAARVRHGRPVSARPEDEVVYETVRALRRLGRQVYRAGADHKVDGRLLSTRQLIELACSLDRGAGTATESDPST